MIRNLLLILLSLTLSLSAGIIEYSDDDQQQYLEFDVCDDSTYQIKIYVSLNPDSGWTEIIHTRADTMFFPAEFHYIAPDRDEFDNLIPGHYAGEYWYYTIDVKFNGDEILSADTVHQVVDYTIGGGCIGTHHVD